MSKKYYRVTTDNFLWRSGAVIAFSKEHSSEGGYTPIEDIWDTTPVNGSEYISARIIEHPDNAEFFERVYPDDLGGKIYRTADQLKKLYEEKMKG